MARSHPKETFTLEILAVQLVLSYRKIINAEFILRVSSRGKNSNARPTHTNTHTRKCAIGSTLAAGGAAYRIGALDERERRV